MNGVKEQAEWSRWAIGGPSSGRQVLQPQLWHVELAGQMAAPETEAHYSVSAATVSADVAQHVYTQACDCRGQAESRRGGVPSSCGRTTNQREHALSKRTVGDQVGAAKVEAKFLIS